LLVAASLIGPAGLFTAAALHNRTDVMREGEERVVRSARVMDEHARKVLETGELVLGRVDDRMRGMSWSDIAAPETSSFLAELEAPLEQVVSIWVTDAQGVVRAGSQPWSAAMIITDREFFQVQRERNVGTYISAAFWGRATGVPSFAISRRRPTADGHFDGIVHLALSPDYFANTYAAAATGVGEAAVLMRSDGEVLARRPFYAEGQARVPSDSPFLRQIALKPEGGSFLGVFRRDGVERAYAYRKVGRYPVYVIFGVDKAALLSRWRDNVALYGAVACMASALLLLISWFALRGVQAERTTMRRLREALDDLRHETVQREAAEARVRQAQKMEAVGQLTGGIAHDFNNLLMAVLGSLQLLRKRLPAGDDRASRLLENAVQAAQRGASLTQRLLAFSRGQALRPRAVNVAELVHGMSDLLRSSLGSGVRVTTDFPSALPPMLVDANQLELALLNLAMNARDAMQAQGELTIAARQECVGKEQGGELEQGSYVVLAVADTGEGMDEVTLARSVEPFFTTKGVGKGRGLGLSMVYGLAAQSGGWLILRSRKDEGTTAELWLLQAQTQATPAQVPGVKMTEPRLESSARRTVLVVDDDPLVLAATVSMLEDIGHSVLEAASGRQALEILRCAENVDVVLAD